MFRGPWGIRKHRHPGSQLLRVLTIYSCDPLLYPCGGLCQAWVGVYKLGDRPQWAVTSDSGTEAYWVELRMGTLLHNTASTRLHQPSRVPAVGIYPFTVPLRLHLTTQKGPRLVSARAILKAIRTQPNGKMDECHQPLSGCVYGTPRQLVNPLGPSLIGLPGSLTGLEIAWPP